MNEEPTKNRANKPVARSSAKKLLKNAGVTVPAIQISSVIDAVKSSFADIDLTIMKAPAGILSDKVDAVTQRKGSAVFILWNDSKPPVRKRFSVAHEIGHLFMGHLHGSSSHEMDTGTMNFDEVEANEFAAYLLMPPEMIQKDIKSGIKDVRQLAARYQVSEEAMWRQLNNTGIINQLC